MSRVEEYGSFPSGHGTFTRPDSSGIRGGFDGRTRRSWSRSGGSDDDEKDQFPYDIDPSYGEPAAYDRGSKGGSLHGTITPKDTSHSVWDDIEEVMGSPILIGKAVQGAQMGHATGVPGATGDWASMPIRPWDVDDDDVDEGFMGRMTIDPSVPPPEPVPNAGSPKFHDQTDDEVERKVDRVWGRDDNDSMTSPGQVQPAGTIFIVGSPAPFAQGTGLAMRPSRGRVGLIPKESAWDALLKLMQNG